MKKSELIARYEHFGKDINVITQEQFFDVLNVHENNLFKEINHRSIDCDTDCMSFGLDGCDYYYYSSKWNVGWEGDVDVDGIFFNIVTMTEKEREDMMKIFTQENDYSNMAIGGDDCELLL